MLEKRMSNAQLESAYDLIADGLDTAGSDHQSLFLAKLALALANLTGNIDDVADAVNAALRDL